MSSLLAEFLKATHRHPFFNLGMAALFSFWVTFSFNYFAVASEVREIKTELNGVGATVKRSALEAHINSLEKWIFDLERMVEEGTARDIDYNRLARYRSELGNAERKLARID